MKPIVSLFVKAGFLVVLGVGILRMAIGVEGTSGGERKGGGYGLEFGKAIPIAVNSHPVEWRDATFHLVKLDTIQFSLSRDSHLQAELESQVTMFDDVLYDVSAAVLDREGRLLGTARTQCETRRRWLGNTLTTFEKLNLDFGVSLQFADADSFLISISEREVLTPDDWQQ